MTQPLVSVAIITFNQIGFLRECIESVLSQSYSNIEIVVADDCSTDGTAEMLCQYAYKYPNKFLLRLAESNKGITINSNEAHFACRGKYIAWMGGDDLMLPDKLASQVELMEADPNVVLCYHNLDVFDSSTGRTLYHYNRGKIEGSVDLLVKHGPFNGACSTMVRRSVTPLSGFDTRLPIASDWLYWVQTAYSGGQIRYLDLVLGRHRRHEGNVTGPGNKAIFRNFQDHLLSCSIILSERPDLYNEVKYRVSEILIALRLMNGGQNYKNYLIAALSFSFSLKALLGLLISFFGIRR